MNQIVANDALTSQLRAVPTPCAIVDGAGNKLGDFVPQASRALYNGYECPRSREELAQIKRKGGGLPLADILRELESRHPA